MFELPICGRIYNDRWAYNNQYPKYVYDAKFGADQKKYQDLSIQTLEQIVINCYRNDSNNVIQLL